MTISKTTDPVDNLDMPAVSFCPGFRAQPDGLNAWIFRGETDSHSTFLGMKKS